MFMITMLIAFKISLICCVFYVLWGIGWQRYKRRREYDASRDNPEPDQRLYDGAGD